MDVKQAVAIAKAYVLELFAEERLSDIGLEEVEFNESAKAWEVTVGFSRPWDKPNTFAALAQPGGFIRRNYKRVRIAEPSGDVISVKDRELRTAV